MPIRARSGFITLLLRLFVALILGGFTFCVGLLLGREVFNLGNLSHVHFDGSSPESYATYVDEWTDQGIGKDENNVHVVWTSFQQASSTKGIMGGPALARARLLQMKALTIPSLVKNFELGGSFAWLVYYDAPGQSDIPDDIISELRATVDALPFAKALEAPVKAETGLSQKYSYSGGKGGFQHTKALKEAIEDGAFTSLSRPPTLDTVREAITITMTFVKAGNALPKKFIKDVQGRLTTWEKRVKLFSDFQVWPPEVSGVAQGQWPTPDAPEGSATQPALLLCAWHSISWQDSSGSKKLDYNSAGALTPSKHERRCVPSGLTVHQRLSDSISKIASTKVNPHGSSKTKWYQGMEVQYMDRTVVGLVMDKAMVLEVKIADIRVLVRSFGAVEENLKMANDFMIKSKNSIGDECNAVGSFAPCTGF